MSQQKALLIKEEKAAFIVGTLPIPKPGPGDILIRIKATALNPGDWKQKKYGFLIDKYPAVLGSDLAGDVEELGEGVEGFSKGDKVFALGYLPKETRAFQQYCVIPSDMVGRIPSNIDYGQAATIPLGYCSAAVGLLAALPAGAGLNPTCDPTVNFSGQPAFVFGGSSSVGQFAIQLLRILGYSTIITYASGKHADFLKSLGATHVVDRKEVSITDLPAVVQKIAGAPIKIVYDAISEDDTRAASVATLAEGGIAISVDMRAEEWNKDGKRSINIFGLPHSDRKFAGLLWRQLSKQVADGTIVPNRVEKLPNGLAGITDGLKRLEDNLVSGVKLVAFPEETP
ncbi:chaperonin 10-like protein [Mycena vulgaris]|nr:chaperonin 10-like protein [Mycena vulgaris]